MAFPRVVFRRVLTAKGQQSPTRCLSWKRAINSKQNVAPPSKPGSSSKTGSGASSLIAATAIAFGVGFAVNEYRRKDDVSPPSGYFSVPKYASTKEMLNVSPTVPN